MADEKTTTLPEGTDKVIAGASNVGTTSADGTVTVEETASVIEREIIAPGTSAGIETPSASGEAGLRSRLRGGRERLGSQAGEKARGLVTQGLERTAEALANVSRMVGDTADGIEERLGAEYGNMRAAPRARSRTPPTPWPKRIRTS